ncbi:MAG: flagellar hook-basal body protein [Lachnospiraceae bacterium]|nr:flagellar hook-basal body protein [Lachnospiraceae bacterium]
MMRSLWTAATGMKAQQTGVDTISNNIANVNTTAYKSQSTQFKNLLYQTLQTVTTSANGDPKPTGAQVGLGTRVASTNASFKQGAMKASDNPSALCIEGSGFLAVRGADGGTYYTRDGDLFWTINNTGGRELANSSGNPVLDTEGNVIVLPEGASADTVVYDDEGLVSFKNPDGTYTSTEQRIALFQFANPTGLEKESGNLYSATESSGAPINEQTTDLAIIRSSIRQGYTEMSNVNVADEMVNLIITQRAYELNSKAITTSDSMLDTANNLRR